METNLRDDIRFINKFLYSIQKHRIMLNNWKQAKEKDGIEPSKRVLKLTREMSLQEAAARRMALDIVSFHPLWGYFFANMRGISESLATSLMAEIGDISRFNNPSRLWGYAGLVGGYFKSKCSAGHKFMSASDMHRTCPIFSDDKDTPCGAEVTVVEQVKGKAPKRTTGWHYLFNSRLKTTCWKISGQLVKQGDAFYRNLYLTKKEYYRNRAVTEGLTVLPAPEMKGKTEKDGYMSVGHIDNRARRHMVKVFLVHLWEAWREVEGLELRTPYVIEKLGHQGYVKWADLLERIRARNKETS